MTAAGTESSYAPSKDDKGKFIQVVVTDAEGVEFPSSISNAVTEDKSAEIKLVDKSGLQTDGTALESDTLEVSYGSDLGTPKTIIWYCNGAAKAVYTIEGGVAIQNGFTSDHMVGLKPAGQRVLDAGEWYVTIENTAGQTSATNTITVADSSLAIVSDVALADDYETANAANIVWNNVDARVAMSVTLNKDYSGILYVYKGDATKYNKTQGTGTGQAVAILDLTANNVEYLTEAAMGGSAGGKTGVIKYTKKSQLTPAKAYALAAGNGTGDETALKYVDADTGKVTYMFVPETGAAGAFATASLERGQSYKVAFDQEGIESDDIKTADRTDITVSEAVVAPYVKAPATIAVTSYDSDNKTTAELSFYDADGKVMDWWTQANAHGVSVGGSMFNVASNTTSTSDSPIAITDLDITKGVGVATYAGTGATYAYAKIKTVAGIFAKDAAELVAPVVESAPKAATKVEITESTATPENAIVKFTGLHNKADGKVYIIQGESTKGTKALIEAKGVEAAVASADVKGGSTEVEVPSVFKQAQITGTANNLDDFVAVFVPADTTVYSKVSSDLFTLQSIATSLSFKAVDNTMVTVTDTAGSDATNEVVEIVTDTSKVDTLNQFGTAATSGFKAVNDAALTVTANNAGGDTVEKVNGGKYSVAANGVVTIDVNLASAVDQGDGFTISVLGSEIKAVSKFGQGKGNGLTNDNVFKVTLGTNTLQDVAVTALTATTTAGLQDALAGAAGRTSENTAITLNTDLSASPTTKVVTLAAGDSLVFGTNGKLKFGQDAKVYGSIDQSSGADFDTNGKTVTMYDGASFKGSVTAAKITAAVFKIDTAATTKGVAFVNGNDGAIAYVGYSATATTDTNATVIANHALGTNGYEVKDGSVTITADGADTKIAVDAVAP